MADPAKLSALTELAEAPAASDEFYVRDVSEAAVDESKRITYINLAIPTQSTQSALEARTNENSYPPPDLIHHSPSATKAWVLFQGGDADPITNLAGYNMDATTDIGTGNQRPNFSTDFSSANYGAGMVRSDRPHVSQALVDRTAGGFTLQTTDNSDVAEDATRIWGVWPGDH